MVACMMAVAITALSSIAYAEETQTIAFQVMKTEKETTLYEQPDINTRVIQHIEKETVVVIKEKVDDTWSRVSYQEKEGYIQNNTLIPVEDVEKLDKEFEWIYNDDMLWYAEIMETLKQERQARIWGSCIVILVIAIFGIGILSSIKKNKENKDGEKIQ